MRSVKLLHFLVYLYLRFELLYSKSEKTSPATDAYIRYAALNDTSDKISAIERKVMMSDSNKH
jgi:hypothetical protein